MTEKNGEKLVVDAVALRSLDRCIDCLNEGKYGNMWMFSVIMRKGGAEEEKS